jgi:hypothetical protein
MAVHASMPCRASITGETRGARSETTGVRWIALVVLVVGLLAANDSVDGGTETDSCVFDSGDFVTNCP